jgi:hypothetical protein
MRRTLSVIVVLFALSAALYSPLSAQDKEVAPRNPAFEKFKLLAGEWVGRVKEGGKGIEGELIVKYKVTSGGSALVETIFPGMPHEMVTVIHPDGANLLLTHYCALGNQPHMKASPRGDTNQVEFKFVRATNLKSEKDKHMHDVTFTFVDADTLRTEWTHFDGGKDTGKVVFEFKRKK